jgi:hypothetical protein
MKNKISFLILIILVIFTSCKHDEGYGGLATIKGKIYAKDYNSNGGLVAESYIGGVKIYISKHGETAYFDDINSSYDGSFEFKFLYRGKYDIWVFGDCDSCAWDQNYQLRTIEITDKRQIVILEDIIISI